jgi:hypothetical protein
VATPEAGSRATTETAVVGPPRGGASARFRHRLPAIGVLAFVGVLYLLLSDRLTVGPRWLPLAAIAVLVAVGVVELARPPRPDIVRAATLAVTAGVTVGLAGSTVLLVTLLVNGGLPGLSLLEGAAVIWVVNLLTFAVWYWEVDGGGPLARHLAGPGPTDFLFPQYTISHAAARVAARRSALLRRRLGRGPLADARQEAWMPEFVDYLFLAFNTSSAFSPTDTLTLSRRAKVLMMVQSLISLLTIAVLAARAINILR